MFYFIPSWYSEQRDFYDATVPWYRYSNNLKLDAITSLFKLFRQAEQPSVLLILGYMPNLRYYLHEVDLYEQSYVSIFDILQNTEDISSKMVTLESLDWPKEVEFIYTPFLIIVEKSEQLFAEVHFGNDGQIIWINYFEEGNLIKRFIIDDRGFLSSILYFNSVGDELYQDFLSFDGVWQFRQHLTSEHTGIEVNPLVSSRFKHSYYDSLPQLIEEVLESYFEKSVSESDTIILSYNEIHNELVANHLLDQSLIISFFQTRRKEYANISMSILDKAQLILTGSVLDYQMLKSRSKTMIANIPPYDARLSLGKSQRIRELIIYMLVDNITFDDLSKVIDITFDVMDKNQNIELILVSYRMDIPFKNEIEHFFNEKEKEWLIRNDELTKESFESQYQHEIDTVGKTLLEEEYQNLRFKLLVITSENQLLQQLDTARLIVDLSFDPDLYTQIAGISAGIPQVNRVSTGYVENFKNGYIIQGMEELKDIYEFYLLTLRNWNEALVYAVSQIGDYTSGSIVEKILMMMKEKNE